MLIGYELISEYAEPDLWENILGTATLKDLMIELWNITKKGEWENKSANEAALFEKVSDMAIKYYKNPTAGNIRRVLSEMQQLSKHNQRNMGFVDLKGVSYIANSNKTPDNSWVVSHPDDNENVLFSLTSKNNRCYITIGNATIDDSNCITQKTYTDVFNKVNTTSDSKAIDVYLLSIIRGFLIMNKQWKYNG
jgi:hypothetical protein